MALYLDHFGLNEPPFRITPHPDFFFDGADRGATLEGLLYAILHDEGIVKVSGEIGSGKTTLCRVMMERLPPRWRRCSSPTLPTRAPRSCTPSPRNSGMPAPERPRGAGAARAAGTADRTLRSRHSAWW